MTDTAERPPEEWRPIPGWSRRYEVSDLGRIRSLKRITKYTQGNRAVQRTLQGRVLRLGAHVDGYPQADLYRDGVARTVSVHCVVLTTFVGPPAGRQCRHLDGNPKNNTLENLRWGTPTENAADRLLHGRAIGPRGTKSGSAKLTGAEVYEIRHRIGDGELHSAIAVEFGISPQTVSDIKHRRRWAWLP